MRRRTLLTLVGTAGVAGIAGCSGGGGDGTDANEDDSTDERNDDSTATTAGQTTATATGTRPATATYDFEQGLDAWTVRDDRLKHSTSNAVSGSGSAFIDADRDVSTIASTVPTGMDGGARIERFSYAFFEREESFGGGVALVNDADTLEVFTGTNNPEWVVLTDTNQPTVTKPYSGDGYKRWVRSELAFDWDAGTVEATFTDTVSGTTRSEMYELGAGKNVERIELRGFTSAEYTSGRGFYTDSCVMFWDDVRVRR